ncbi:MAG: N-acylglucosamine 2-epimerase [Chitinophagaceae bacterium]|nr:MAG: N-acylglucosamine 2-epimerase [Chitinophagaceae bacterium]
MKNIIASVIFSCLVCFGPVCFAQTKQSFDTVLSQMKFSAKKELIDVYYPRNIDSLYGGYLSDFSYDFKPVGQQDKMIVTQARHVWTTSKATAFYKDTTYLAMARHGYLFLRDKMWDKQFGGFYTLVNRKGEMISDKKEAYGNAFGLYALAAYYKTSRDPEVLNLAKKSFSWLEQNSHDPVSKGYFQHLERSGKPIRRRSDTPLSSDLGYKDQNSSIHLLEAFTELYAVWPDPLLKTRLQEMLLLIRDTMVHEKGYLQLFFTPDWKPVTNRDSGRAVILQRRSLDHVSFGHDVETAFLMMEATEILGNQHDQKTLAVGKKMVDHALKTGWDPVLAGFYDQGYYFRNTDTLAIIKQSKNWWAQAEGLNTLMIFSRLYPSDKLNYALKFLELWNYVQLNLIDHVHGDWYEEGIDHDPSKKTSRKSHIWKAAYHNFRSLSNCIRMLEKK